MVQESGPYFKLLTGTLGMVLPVASSAVKLKLDETAYKIIEEQLDFGKYIIDATLGELATINEFMGEADSTDLEHGVASAPKTRHCANSTPCSKPKTPASAVSSA